MDLGRAGPVALRNGLFGLPLWEADEGAFAQAQLVAAKRFWDTDWLRRRQLAALAST